MKNNNRRKYSEIVSFGDFQFEKDKLKFEKKLIETRLDFRFTMIKDASSASQIFSSIAKVLVGPRLLSFIGDLTRKKETEEDCQEK